MKTCQVVVRVPVEYKEKLQKLAKDHEITQSDVIEALLDGSDTMQKQNKERVKKCALTLLLSPEHRSRFHALTESCYMTQEGVVKTLLNMSEAKITSCCETKRQENIKEKKRQRVASSLRMEEDADENLMNWLENRLL
ncbi:MAG: ribbon-helix-helix protein, CopG family [Azoarcus sp.]|jgi:hypothetical protein|nr:ribbon-helix-helix protein, CopG family [Azoarcus sp.]